MTCGAWKQPNSVEGCFWEPCRLTAVAGAFVPLCFSCLFLYEPHFPSQRPETLYFLQHCQFWKQVFVAARCQDLVTLHKHSAWVEVWRSGGLDLSSESSGTRVSSLFVICVCMSRFERTLWFHVCVRLSTCALVWKVPLLPLTPCLGLDPGTSGSIYRLSACYDSAVTEGITLGGRGGSAGRWPGLEGGIKPARSPAAGPQHSCCVSSRRLFTLFLFLCFSLTGSLWKTERSAEGEPPGGLEPLTRCRQIVAPCCWGHFLSRGVGGVNDKWIRWISGRLKSFLWVHIFS